MLKCLACAQKLTLLLVGSAIALTSANGEDWTAQFEVSGTGQLASFAQVAAWGDGSATAIWLSTDSLPGTAGYRIRTSDFINGSWSAPTVVSELGVTNAPDVAASTDGKTVAVWHRDGKLEGSVRSTPPAPLGTPTFFTPTLNGGFINSFTLGLNASGTGALAFYQSSDRLSIFPITDGVFGSAASITPSPSVPPNSSRSPGLAALTTGQFFVAYNYYNPPNTIARLLGPLTSSATTFSAYPTGVRDVVLSNHSSGPISLWRDSATQRYAMMDGVGPNITFISAAGMDTAGPPRVASDGVGNVVAAWYERVTGSGEGRRVMAAVRPAGESAFGAPVVLSEEDSDPGRGPSIDIAAIAPDDFVVVWDRDNGSTTQIEAARKRPGAAFQDLADQLNSNPRSTARFPTVSGDGQGGAVVVWVNAATAGSTLYYRVFASVLGAGGGGGGGGEPVFDPGPLPQIKKLRVSRQRFAAGGRYNEVVAPRGSFTRVQPDLGLAQPLRVGTDFLFKSNVAGSLRVEITTGGRATTNNLDKKSVAPVVIPVRKAKQTLKLTARAGTNRVRFLGQGLRPGFLHTAEFTVTTAAGTSKPARVTFIVDAPAG